MAAKAPSMRRLCGHIASRMRDFVSQFSKRPEMGRHSFRIEDRFENWETKSRILDAMGRKDDASKALSAAINKASAIQLYSYARGLQRQGNAKRAFELYPKFPRRTQTTGSATGALENGFQFPATSRTPPKK